VLVSYSKRAFENRIMDRILVEDIRSDRWIQKKSFRTQCHTCAFQPAYCQEGERNGACELKAVSET